MQLAHFEVTFQVGNLALCVRAGGQDLLPLVLDFRSSSFVLLVGELTGGALYRNLGVLDGVGDVVERHPELFLTKVLREVAPNIHAVLQVRGRRRDEVQDSRGQNGGAPV